MVLNVFKNLKICLWNFKRGILERACLLVFKSFYKTIQSLSVDRHLEFTGSSLRMYVSYTSLVSLREDKGDTATQRRGVVMGCPTTCQEWFPGHFTRLVPLPVKKRKDWSSCTPLQLREVSPPFWISSCARFFTWPLWAHMPRPYLPEKAPLLSQECLKEKFWKPGKTWQLLMPYFIQLTSFRTSMVQVKSKGHP